MEGRRKYKGVQLRKWGKSVSEIRLPNSRELISLGSYDAPEKSARAFDATFVSLRGHQASAAAEGLTPGLTAPAIGHTATASTRRRCRRPRSRPLAYACQPYPRRHRLLTVAGNGHRAVD
ncbi:hypothetical protein QYE76_025766 [Lolium multiflorum]|uniref:AP2/ERF domain-containing protein n=1 Tax=Lolium multiflorum TaxID=4521 RepID=A0AAD8RIG6_LOLMU|nr:hypothetical protein QYE76_025766 [Lolium multiflorum]